MNINMETPITRDDFIEHLCEIIYFEDNKFNINHLIDTDSKFRNMVIDILNFYNIEDIYTFVANDAPLKKIIEHHKEYFDVENMIDVWGRCYSEERKKQILESKDPYYDLAQYVMQKVYILPSENVYEYYNRVLINFVNNVYLRLFGT